MTNSQRLSAVRTAVCKWITDRHPGQDDCGKPLSEAMLIREGFFCGRRFRFQLYQAVWFLEEDEVKIVSLDGEVIARLDATEIDSLARSCNAGTDDTHHTLSIAAHLENTLAAKATGSQATPEDERSGDAHHRRAA